MRLFHREYECYIVAEGSFAEDPAVIEDGKQPQLARIPLYHSPPSLQPTAGNVTQIMAF